MKRNRLHVKEIKTLSLGIMKSVLSISAGSLLLFASCKKKNLSEDNLANENSTAKYSSGFSQDPNSRYDSGDNNGYFWSLYQDGGGATLTNGARGNFSIGYQNVNDVVGGKGWRIGAARNIGYNIGALSGSYNFVGVYGWTKNPLIEYYVAERGSVAIGSHVNDIPSDGHYYSFYKHKQENQPSIIGTQTFWQYQDTWGGASLGVNHSINMATHINNWRSRGGQGFGSYDYQVFGLEAYGGKSGYINATVW